MLSQKEKIQLEEHQLYEDISSVEELRKQEVLESGEKTNSSKAVGLVYLLIAGLFIAICVFLVVLGETSNEDYMAAVASRATLSSGALTSEEVAAYVAEGAPSMLHTLLLAIFGFLGLLSAVFGFVAFFGKGHKDVRATRDEYAPSFVPEGEFTLSSDEPLLGANRAKIKSIKNDGAKRQYTDKRKAQRILDPSITFEALKKSLMVSFARHSFDMNDQAAEKLIAAISYSRIIFLKGVKAEDRKDYFDALIESFQMQGHFADAGKTFDDILGSVSLLPEKKKSFLLGVSGLYAQNAKDYFSTHINALDDPSEDHVYSDGTLISMNLMIVCFLDESDDAKGIDPALLVHNAYLKLALPRLDQPFMGDAYSIRATSDEIRYLASKATAVHYFSETKLSSYDVVVESAAKFGYRLPNDVENGMERIAAVLLNYGMEEDRVSAFIITTCFLPYILSAYDDKTLAAEGSFNEALSREFVSNVEQMEIKEFRASYINKEISKKAEEPLEQEAPAEEESPVEEAPAPEKKEEEPAPKEEKAEEVVEEPAKKEKKAASNEDDVKVVEE